MKRYRVTCLTPTLVGDGQKLAPIDYMVWRDHVNVLDQNRIFRLLARGPRLDSYLSQIRRAEKLDFASWGGYAQNFAARRIPFDDPAAASAYERARAEDLFVPTFATRNGAPYLPATAIKGPLRTALALTRVNDHMLRELEQRMGEDRPPRYPAESVEEAALGASRVSRTRSFRVADSEPIASGGTKVYLLRTATLVARGQKLELGWKMSPRGTVEGRRAQDATPTLAEMASPGSVFEGTWSRSEFLSSPAVLRQFRWKEAPGAAEFAAAANNSAEALLKLQAEFAQSAGLPAVEAGVQGLVKELEQAQARAGSCLLCVGWGGGLLSKSVLLRGGTPLFSQVLRQHPLYGRSVQTGLPFPKTRRVVFSQQGPSSLPGWVRLDLES